MRLKEYKLGFRLLIKMAYLISIKLPFYVSKTLFFMKVRSRGQKRLVYFQSDKPPGCVSFYSFSSLIQKATLPKDEVKSRQEFIQEGQSLRQIILVRVKLLDHRITIENSVTESLPLVSLRKRASPSH